MKKIIYTLTCLALLSFVFHFYNQITLTHKSEKLLSKFPSIPNINCYESGIPRTYFGVQKAKKAVLLLHGYGSAPSEFDPLIAKLKQDNIPYYAPLLTGFALKDFHLLSVVTNTDWMRDAIFGFDLLSSFAETVDVIGHSNGGCLAVFLATQRPVNQLILLDPYLFSNPSVAWKKHLIATPLLNQVVFFLSPLFNAGALDILNPSDKKSAFGFQIVPFHSLFALLQMQIRADLDGPALKQWAKKSPHALFLLYGEEDTTADMSLALQFFKKHKVPLTHKKYPNSGHDLLQDNDQQEVATFISSIVQKEISD